MLHTSTHIGSQCWRAQLYLCCHNAALVFVVAVYFTSDTEANTHTHSEFPSDSIIKCLQWLGWLRTEWTPHRWMTRTVESSPLLPRSAVRGRWRKELEQELNPGSLMWDACGVRIARVNAYSYGRYISDVYLFERQFKRGRVRERELPFYWFTSQRAGPGWNEDPGTPTGSPTWVAGTLEPSPTASQVH